MSNRTPSFLVAGALETALGSLSAAPANAQGASNASDLIERMITKSLGVSTRDTRS